MGRAVPREASTFTLREHGFAFGFGHPTVFVHCALPYAPLLYRSPPEGGTTNLRRLKAVLRTLRHWQTDKDLSGVRDAESLAKLPAEEQEAWKQLWAEVGKLLEKASGKE